MKYLYGASVNGIQNYIFSTNTLREIVGASELIKSISSIFANMTNGMKVEILVNSAGNIKAVFENIDDCKHIVCDMEKQLQTTICGVSVSQAVVEINDKYTQNDMQKLIQNLKIARNIPSIPIDPYISIMKNNPTTAKPIYNYIDSSSLDLASYQKREKYTKWFDERRKENKDTLKFKELNEISNSNNKIAVIHADGNSLGQIIPKLEAKGIGLKKFSDTLDNITKKAFENAKNSYKKIRDIILGGDDMTVICVANIALPFTRDFIEQFEILSKEKLKKELQDIGMEKLTICAGITFCNHKYPFHYAISLAEELCKIAKKDAKSIDSIKNVPSSIMFHNIESSFYQTYEKFIEDELTIHTNSRKIRCDFGPYYLNQENRPSIDNFIDIIKILQQPNNPTNKYREWIKTLYTHESYAQKLLERMMKVNKEFDIESFTEILKKLDNKLEVDNPIVDNKTPIFDILQVCSNMEIE